MLDLSDVIASLMRRGFLSSTDDFDLQAIQTQVDAVLEELGEVARDLRRLRQGVSSLDITKLAAESADVVIAGVCLLARVAGDEDGEAERIIAEKLRADEARGWLHKGG